MRGVQGVLLGTSFFLGQACRSRLREAKAVVFLCHGNIIRSAYAAERLRQVLNFDTELVIQSAGLEAVARRPADSTARFVAHSRGVDLSDHRASPLGTQHVAPGNLILAMEVSHLLRLNDKLPKATKNACLLSCFTRDGPLEIQDPFSGGPEAIARSFDQIDRAIEEMARVLAVTANL